MVPNAGESFLFLPKRTRIDALRAGASLRLRGGERKGAPATRPLTCPALRDLRHPQRPMTLRGQQWRWLVSPAAPAIGPLSWPGHQPGPGPDQLAERARRAKPDPQHGLASIQRDLLHGWVVLGSLRVNERLIQPRYAERVRCAVLSTVARSTDRSRLAGPPPGDSPMKSTMCTGCLPAMMARSCSSRGSTSPLRSCALAAAEALILAFASSWAPAVFRSGSAVRHRRRSWRRRRDRPAGCRSWRSWSRSSRLRPGRRRRPDGSRNGLG